MTARTVPASPNFFAGQKLTGTLMNQISTVQNFWANPPSFRMYQSVTQSIAATTYAQITCDALEYDSDSSRAGSTPWSYVIPAGMTGRWTFAGMVSWNGSATGIRVAALFKNGAQINGANVAVQAGPAANATNVDVSATIAVNAGDIVGLYGWQNSGAALSTQTGGSFPSFFEGRLISLANP